MAAKTNVVHLDPGAVHLPGECNSIINECFRLLAEGRFGETMDAVSRLVACVGGGADCTSANACMAATRYILEELPEE